MTRLIDADAVEKVLTDLYIKRPLDSDRWVIAEIKKGIMDLPTIDAVQVIRCNACRYWSSEDGKSGYCNGFNLVYRKYDADYYCATAEHIEHDD